MGKQGKRKQRQKRKEHKKQEQVVSSVNPSSAVHQLRHADPKTRHAALIALQTTILHPEQTKKISLSVLQAVREQVMDSNLECASAAAECLAQYLFFANDTYKETTAGWVLVLISRLDQCFAGIREKPTKAWYALAAPCLRALCKLVEVNELALEQVHTQTLTFMSMIFGLLQSSLASMETATSTAPVDDRFVEWIRETTIFAARTLHSSLDENEELGSSVQQDVMEPWSGNQLSKLPELAQLHMTGSIVTLYQLAPTQWQSLLPNAVNCLTKFLAVDSRELLTLEDNYREAKQLWQNQKEDDELEQEIIKKVQARREPARSIAQRQKAKPREDKTSMEPSRQDEQDGRQAMEDALIAWNGVILPMQVALEITANLLSCLIPEEDSMAVEKDDSLDETLRGGLVAAKLTERCFQMLQAVCNYQHEQSQENESLKEDLDDGTSKISGCLVNCVLGGVMSEAEVMPSWKILRQYAHNKGVCSTLVVMTQQNPSLRELLCQDVELFAGLLQTKDGEVQRDAVCLLAAALSGPTPVEIVSRVTTEMIHLLNDGLTASVKVEVLNGFMNLYGDDDFHPQVFDNLKVLGAIQQSLSSLPKEGLDPEEEEILFNANRFVDYKLGR
jgi:hypothetical protein